MWWSERLYYSSFKLGRGIINDDNASRDLDQQGGAFCWDGKLLGSRQGTTCVCRCKRLRDGEAGAAGGVRCRQMEAGVQQVHDGAD